jgi:CHAD domain-containing protein
MNASEPQSLLQTKSAEEQIRLVFDRMARQIGRVLKDPKPNAVHKFRTNSRRVETVVSNLAAENSNSRKLLKKLSKLRRRAGRVRDLDVQIAFLKDLKIPDRQEHRAALLQKLSNDQAKQSKKFAKHFDPDLARKLRKRLQKAKAEIRLNGADPLKLAFARLPKAGAGTLNEKTLHACRILAKQSRYLAELAADSGDAKIFVQELKRAQDEIGRWHDILKLTERAEEMFGGVRDSSLVSALQNISHAHFRRAANALQASLKSINELEKQSRTPVGSKPAAAVDNVAVAAA